MSLTARQKATFLLRCWERQVLAKLYQRAANMPIAAVLSPNPFSLTLSNSDGLEPPLSEYQPDLTACRARSGPLLLHTTSTLLIPCNCIYLSTPPISLPSSSISFRFWKVSTFTFYHYAFTPANRRPSGRRPSVSLLTTKSHGEDLRAQSIQVVQPEPKTHN